MQNNMKNNLKGYFIISLMLPFVLLGIASSWLADQLEDFGCFLDRKTDTWAATLRDKLKLK